MASSQVEIASSSPFGCVLRDHNRSNVRAAHVAFQKNLKNFVRDHFNSCISNSSSDSDSSSDENSHNPQIKTTENSLIVQEHSNNNKPKIDRWSRAREMVSSKGSVKNHETDNGNCWVGEEQRDKITNNGKIDHWARAREMVSTFHREESPARSESSVEIPNNVGVSSLVQKWRDFAKQNQSVSSNSSPVHPSRANSESELGHTETVCVIDEPTRRCEDDDSVDERFGTPSIVSTEDSIADWESGGNTPSPLHCARGRDSEAVEREKERVKVSDIVRKLSSTSSSTRSSLNLVNDDNDREQPLLHAALSHEFSLLDHLEQQRSLLPVTSSPRLRGRQAFNDLLVKMERDRHRELEGLVERRAVSKFSHKGRIQAMLRLRFLREATVGNRRHLKSVVSDSNRQAQGSNITLLRERFNTGSEHDAANSRTPRAEVVNNTGAEHDAVDSRAPRAEVLTNTGVERDAANLRIPRAEMVNKPAEEHDAAKSRTPFADVGNNTVFEHGTANLKKPRGEVGNNTVFEHGTANLRIPRAEMVSKPAEEHDAAKSRTPFAEVGNNTLFEHGTANLKKPRGEVGNNTVFEHGTANLKKPRGEVINNPLKEEKSSTSNRLLEHDAANSRTPRAEVLNNTGVERDAANWRTPCAEVVNNTSEEHDSVKSRTPLAEVRNNTVFEHGTANLKKPRGELVNNTLKEEKSCTSNRLLEHDAANLRTPRAEVVNNTRVEHGAANLSNCSGKVVNNSTTSNQLLEDDTPNLKTPRAEVVNTTRMEHSTVDLRNPRGEVVSNTLKEESCSISNQKPGENIHHMEYNNAERQKASLVRNFVLKVEKSSASNQSLRVTHHQEVNNTEKQSTCQVETSSTSNQLLGEDIHHKEVNKTEKQNSTQLQSVSCKTEDTDETSACLNALWQRTSYEVSSHNLHESTDTVTYSNGWEDNEKLEEQETNNESLVGTDHGCARENFQQSDGKEQEAINHQQVGREHDWIGGDSSLEGDWEKQEANHRHLVETNCDWISDISRAWNNWENDEANHQHLEDTDWDWTSEISRPRSDWEGLRQARYEEMLDPYANNEDIRQLLNRSCVSTFLSSNLRDTVDQLMISRVQRPPHPISNQEEEQEEDLQKYYFHRQTHPMGNQQNEEQEKVDEEEAQEEEEEEEEEEECPFAHQYDDVCEYSDQAASPIQSPLKTIKRSCSHDRDCEVSYDSDQVVSPSLPQPPSTQSSYHPSFETELIYDLRGQMQLLHNEIYELRRSIKSCMSMQAKMQRSMKQEVTTAASHSARGEMTNGTPGKRSCRVCHKMQVDSLLYRCGHMCTCFKCAHELQWSSGKCPICQAPILDIVQVH